MKAILLLCFVALIANLSFAQIKYNPNFPPVEIKGTQLINFKSDINKQEYEVYIELPASYKDSINRRYPVLYVLDGQWFFPEIIRMRESLRHEGFVPEMIVVGIGWPDNYHENRIRDFFPAGIKDTMSGGGGAPDFLKVLKSEIMNFVNSNYRTDRKTNILQGQSAGGAFALYSLFHDPDLFNSFIISCPSLWYDDGIFFQYEETFARKQKELNKKIFITSSEYEEAMFQTTVSLYKKFIEQLEERKYKGLDLETLVVEKMGHATQYTYAVPRGLQFVFGKPDLIVDSSLMDQYVGNYEFGISVFREGKSLFADNPQGRVKLHAETKEKFYVKGVPGTFEFIKDTNGKVTGFMMKAEGNAMTAKKIN